MITNLRGIIGQLRRTRALSRYGRYRDRFGNDLSWTAAAQRFPTRNELHAYCHHYFLHLAPREIREHRRYFSQEMRGFGEDAFHAFWWMLLREKKPLQCLEIGVYRGQILSLWGLCAKLARFDAELHGISPFEPLGDAVSVYRNDVDYYRETEEAVQRFGDTDPVLICGLSESAVAREHLSTREWDLIYIDGCHDYEAVLHDYRLAKRFLRVGGTLVMDDASLQTDFRAPAFSFAGHPGPSSVARQFADKEMKFLGAVGHLNAFEKP